MFVLTLFWAPLARPPGTASASTRRPPGHKPRLGATMKAAAAVAAAGATDEPGRPHLSQWRRKRRRRRRRRWRSGSRDGIGRRRW